MTTRPRNTLAHRRVSQALPLLSRTMTPVFVATLVLATAVWPSLAKDAASASFASFFAGDAVVLLHNATVDVWGTSSVAAVDLLLDGRVVAAGVAVRNKQWRATLPPTPAGYNYSIAVVPRGGGGGGANASVAFGIALLCSGQSNMQMIVGPGYFSADNSTAESAAAGRFSGISLLQKGRWVAASSTTVQTFSAVCWYTGKDLWMHMGGRTPVGLMDPSAGGTPIEYWVRSPNDVASCGDISGPCWNATPGPATGLAHLYDELVKPLVGLGVSAILWDQAEQDVGCHAFPPTPVSGGDSVYRCLQQALVDGWRSDFAGAGTTAIPWIGVQLPGYGPGVFEMRLAQAAGAASLEQAAITATYDLSCQPRGEQPSPHCPYGAVHNPHKQSVGARLALQLRRLLLGEALITEGPSASQVDVSAPSRAGGNWSIVVSFEGGTAPFFLAGTGNCSTCCGANSGSDFDATVDGKHWVMGTTPSVSGSTGTAITFTVALPAAPKWVRYTASRIYPQCAVYNGEKLPALPFQKAPAHVS